MKGEILARFSAATREVLKMMLDIDVEDASLEASGAVAESVEEIAISIGLTGDFSGETDFYFPRGTALEMVKIMSGMAFDEVDDFVISAMGEISNIISGNATTELSKQKIICDILPPKIAVGDKDALCPSGKEVSRSIQTTIHTSAGDVGLAVKLL